MKKKPKISLVYPLTFSHRDEKWHDPNKFVLYEKRMAGHTEHLTKIYLYN